MYLIFISAKDQDGPDDSNEDRPEIDLQPIMLAVSKPNLEYILREADSRDIEVDKPEGHEDIERIFVKVRESKPGPDDKDGPGVDPKDFEQSIEANEARMAVALATIYFGGGKTEPFRIDYVDHVKSRSRVADRIVVAGYSDPDCTMEQSEALCLGRALRIRETLAESGITAPIVAVSRPKCCYTEDDKRSRRVEVTALFDGAGPKRGRPAGRKAGADDREGKNDPDSIEFGLKVARAVSGRMQ